MRLGSVSGGMVLPCMSPLHYVHDLKLCGGDHSSGRKDGVDSFLVRRGSGGAWDKASGLTFLEPGRYERVKLNLVKKTMASRLDARVE